MRTMYAIGASRVARRAFSSIRPRPQRRPRARLPTAPPAPGRSAPRVGGGPAPGPVAPPSGPGPALPRLALTADFAGRILLTVATVHVCGTYVADIISCEGPSMMPTIHPVGDVVLVEMMSHRLWGIGGGADGAADREREGRARARRA